MGRAILDLPTTPIVILTVRPERNKETRIKDIDFKLNSPFCPAPLQKNTLTRNTIVWGLLSLLGMVFSK